MLRALSSGLAGTTAMTVTTAVERRLRSSRDVPVDYDATGHVVTAAATLLRRRPRSHCGRVALFALVHWGYGSAVALEHRALLRTGLSRPAAAAIFYATCQTMAFTLFPTLGDTPPPWRWRRDVLVSSLGQHLVYVLVVAATDVALSGEE